MNTKLLASSVLALSLLMSQASYGHGDHATPPPAISESAALTAASKEVDALVTQGREVDGQKLNESWKQLSPKLSKKGESYYIVSLGNPAEKKTVYILMADYGKIFEANFTGQFKGLNTKN